MIKSFYTTPLWQHDLLEAVKLIHETGFEDVEINADNFGSPSLPHIKLPLTDEEAREFASEIGKEGVSISSLSANVHLALTDATETAKAIDHIKGVINVASAMEVPFVHCMTGRGAPGESQAALRKTLTDAFAEIISYANTKNIRFGIEACAPHLFPNTSDHLQFFKDLQDLTLYVCFDPSHFLVIGEDPAKAVQTLGDRIAHFHVKDAAGRMPNFSFPPLGKGEIDFPALIEQLSAINYNGAMAVEYEAHNFGWKESEDEILKHSYEFLRKLEI
jgi:sugar phosphate isomerase/epimerase